MQNKVVTNFCKIDTIYIKVIALIFVVIIVVIIIIVNVAILFLLWKFSGYSMIWANVSGIKDPSKQDLALEFCRKQIKYISLLTETHIKHDQILHIRNKWLGPIFLSPGSSHTKGLIAQLHPGLEGATEVDTDPKGRFVSFKVTLSNNRVLCFCAP